MACVLGYVDERIMPKNHHDSNHKLANDNFSSAPIPPAQIYATDDALPPEGAVQDCETRLRELVKNNVIATLKAIGFPLLGMGPDGHIASLFPWHPLLKEDKKWVTFTEDSPKPPPERITLSFPMINSLVYNAFVSCGSAKAKAVG